MDGKDFDKLAKRLGGLASRRQTIGGLVAAALGATGLSAEAAKDKKRGFTLSRVEKGKGIWKAQCGNAGCITCSDGVNPTFVNGTLTCAGAATLVCSPGISDQQCGSGGAICTNCGTAADTNVCIPNQGGAGGACGTVPPQCVTGGQCAQRVNGTVQCVDPASNQACGVTAEGTCAPACPQGQQCVSNGANLVCTSATCQNTCPTGCCVGSNDPLGRPAGQCVTGNNGQTDITACGSGGNTCTNCLAVCGFQATCVNGQCSCLQPPPPPPP